MKRFEEYRRRSWMSRGKTLAPALCGAIVGLGALSARAGAGPPDCFDYGADFLHLENTVAMPAASTRAFEIAGDRAYLLTGGLLYNFDVADPTEPVLLGLLPGGGNFQDVQVEGSFAFIANRNYGLEVADVTDPTAMQFVGDLPLVGAAVSVAVAGEVACVAAEYAGLYVVDIANPLDPVLVGHLATTQRCLDVALSGAAALATVEDDVLVIDLQDPVSPVVLDTLVGLGGTRVVVDGTRVYAGGSQFSIVDISNPSIPVILGQLPGSVGGIAVDGDIVMVTASRTLRTIDVSQPASPVTVGAVSTESLDAWLGVKDDFALVEADFEFEVFDISTPASPSPAVTTSLSYVSHFIAEGSYGYVTGDSDPLFELLRVVDLSDPTRPAVVATKSVCSDCSFSGGRLAVGDDRAYVAFYSELYQEYFYAELDISNPLVPVAVGQFLLPVLRDWDAGGGYLYVAESYRLHIVESGAANSDYYAVPADVVTLAGDRAYVAGDATLTILDVGNPLSPVTLGALSTGSEILELAVFGDLLVVGGTDEVVLMTVADPTAPAVLGSVEVPVPARSLTMLGDCVYAASGNEFAAIDISDHTSPVVVGRSGALVGAYDLAAQANEWVLAVGGGRLHLWSPQCKSTTTVSGTLEVAPSRIKLLQNRPNPFNPSTQIGFELDSAATVALGIFDAHGRQVRRLIEAGPHAPAARWFWWDGLNDAGRPVRSGVYSYRLEVDAGDGKNTHTRRMILAR